MSPKNDWDVLNSMKMSTQFPFGKVEGTQQGEESYRNDFSSTKFNIMLLHDIVTSLFFILQQI